MPASDVTLRNIIIMSIVHQDSPMHGVIHEGLVAFVLTRVREAVAGHRSPARQVTGPHFEKLSRLGETCMRLIKWHGESTPAADGQIPRSLKGFAEALFSYLKAVEFMPDSTTRPSLDFVAAFGIEGLVVKRYVNVRSPDELLSVQAARQLRQQQQQQQQQQPPLQHPAQRAADRVQPFDQPGRVVAPFESAPGWVG
jgi:hypothetical protein